VHIQTLPWAPVCIDTPLPATAVAAVPSKQQSS